MESKRKDTQAFIIYVKIGMGQGLVNDAQISEYHEYQLY